MSDMRVEQVQAGLSPPRVRVYLGERYTLLTVAEAMALRDELDAVISEAEDQSGPSHRGGRR